MMLRGIPILVASSSWGWPFVCVVCQVLSLFFPSSIMLRTKRLVAAASITSAATILAISTTTEEAESSEVSGSIGTNPSY